MIVLDINVISELMRPQPHAGVAAMPEGRWRDGFVALVEAMFNEEFAGRVLPFMADAAPHYARIMAARRQAANPIEGCELTCQHG